MPGLEQYIHPWKKALFSKHEIHQKKSLVPIYNFSKWFVAKCRASLLFQLQKSFHTIHTVSFDWFLSGLEWITWSSVTKTFAILPENIVKYQI